MRKTVMMLATLLCAAAFFVTQGDEPAQADPFDPTVTLSAWPNPLQVGSSAQIVASVDQWAYGVEILDADNNTTLVRCNAVQFSCQGTYSAPWSDNNDTTHHFVAHVLGPNDEVVNTDTLDLPIKRTTWDVTVSSYKNPLQVGDSTTLVATADRWAYGMRIKDLDANSTIVTCHSGTTCYGIYTAPWSDNNDSVHHFATDVLGPNDEIVGTSTFDLPIKKTTWDVTLSVNKNPLEAGDYTSLVATADRWAYGIRIKDLDTDTTLVNCQSTTTCYGGFTAPRSDNDGAIHHLAAEVLGPNGEVVGTTTEDLFTEPNAYNISLSASDANESGVRQLTATPSPQFSDTSIQTKIYDTAGSQLAACTGATTCQTSVSEGSFYSVVETSGDTVLAQSTTLTIDENGVVDDTVDGIDLNTLANLYGSAGAICDELTVYQPGTELTLAAQESSLNDQQIACAALPPGATAKAALRAVVAVAAHTTVLAFLADQVSRWPNGIPVSPPLSLPYPTPPTWDTGTSTEDALVQDFEQAHVDGNPKWRTRTAEMARTALRACRAVAAIEDCMSMPIFISGDADLPKSTKHDRLAIKAGQPSVLHWARDEERAGRGWLQSQAPCNEIPAGSSDWCDEYPYASTAEGGPGASLDRVPKREQLAQGGYLGWFYKRCGLRDHPEKSYIAAPAPAGSHLPTLGLCVP